MDTNLLLRKLINIMADLEAIIQEIQSTAPQDKLVRLSLLRQVFILTSIYEAGREVTASEVSAIARRIGRTPGSVSGFYAGNDPFLMRSESDEKHRKLTERAITLVEEYKTSWGDDWMTKLALDPVFSKVSDPNVSEKLAIQIP